MKFLLDQDAYAVTLRLLRSLNHDAVTAHQLGLAAAPDTELLAESGRQGRTMVTRERDYGALTFANRQAGLRLSPATVDVVHNELAHLLSTYTEAELMRAFVVVEPGRHRIRRLAAN